MNHATKILNSFDKYNKLIKLYEERVKIPNLLDNYSIFKKAWFPHPPMLLPLFIDYNSYLLTGVSLNPFSDKESSILKFDLENDYMIEIARDEEQFLTMLALEMNMLEEGVTEEIDKFCLQLDFKGIEQVDKHGEIYGDDPNNIHKLINLNCNTPLEYCNDIMQYTGDYASSERFIITNNLAKASLFEITNKNWFDKIEQIPEWLNPKVDKLELLKEYIRNDDYSTAWLIINSMGMDLEIIAYSLNELKQYVDNSFYTLVAENWLNGYRQSNFK